MKIAILTTCQGMYLEKYLINKFPEVDIKYIVNYEYINKGIPYPNMDDVDIFIYQPSFKTGYETEPIVKRLKENGKITIGFMYFYFSGLYPDDITKNEAFPHPSAKTLELKLLPIYEIVDRIKDVDFLTKEYVTTEATKCINTIKDRERNLDIKTLGFILDNISNHELFHSINHPTNYFLQYVYNQIIDIMNTHPYFHGKIPHMDLSSQNEILYTFHGFVYPSVQKYWNISYSNSDLYLNGNHCNLYDYVQKMFRSQ